MDKYYDILIKIGKDLNISKYNVELDEQYICRILYSALGFWFRTIATTHKKIEGETSKNISKSYMHRRLREVLDAYLSIYPAAGTYFGGEREDDPISSIRKVLLKSSDIIEIGFDSQITNGKEKNGT